MISSVKSLLRRVAPHPLYRLYRRQRIQRLTSEFTPRTVTHEYAGHRLTISLRDPMAAGWYDCDKETPADFRLMRKHGLRPGATVFNLGAFQGIVALMLASEVGPTGKVIAVEGNQHNVEVALENARLNDMRHLSVLHSAVTAEPGVVNFATEYNGRIDDRARVGNARVQAVTIDQLAAEHGFPDVVYMDIEGYELKALYGGSDVLAAGSATWSIEVHPKLFAGGCPDELLRLLAGCQLWIAQDALTGAGERYEPFNGGSLPEDRHFILAAPVVR